MERFLESARIVSMVKDDNCLLAHLGVKHENSSFGLGSSFEPISEDDAISAYNEFMSRHQGQDWDLVGVYIEKEKKMIIREGLSN